MKSNDSGNRARKRLTAVLEEALKSLTESDSTMCKIDASAVGGFYRGLMAEVFSDVCADKKIKNIRLLPIKSNTTFYLYKITG